MFDISIIAFTCSAMLPQISDLFFTDYLNFSLAEAFISGPNFTFLNALSVFSEFIACLLQR